MAYEFSEIDRSQPWFDRLQIRLEDRLDLLRGQNDDKGRDAGETAFIRGQIAEVKKMLADMKPKRKVTPTKQPYV